VFRLKLDKENVEKAAGREITWIGEKVSRRMDVVYFDMDLKALCDSESIHSFMSSM